MKTSELFRKTLKAKLSEMPHGSQAHLADKLGIGRPHINGFLNGRKVLSEDKREEIAEELGYSYLDFLQMGRQMFAEELGIELEKEKRNDIDAELLQQVIEGVEQGLENRGTTLPVDKKAGLIVFLYNHFMMETKLHGKENVDVKEGTKNHLKLVA